jgi:PAS domain S-box-containing protein
MNRTTPTGREVFFGDEEIIVSKTDTKGRITYANDVFLKVAGYRANEVLGMPHSMIRHPEMPRCVFQLLWDTIQKGDEIFAYVVNLAKNGDHYWVLAHVTPTFDAAGKVIGFHSNRRTPDRSAIDAIRPIYARLCEIEGRHASKRDGIAAATEELLALRGVVQREIETALGGGHNRHRKERAFDIEPAHHHRDAGIFAADQIARWHPAVIEHQLAGGAAPPAHLF